MKTATIHSVCECQAKLGAVLDESRHVLRGWATDRRRREETAPAHSIGAHGDNFQVAWSCPFCIRNQLRSFSAGGLAFIDDRSAEASPEAAASGS